VINRPTTGRPIETNQVTDVVLLDLTLPDSHGFDTFTMVHTHVPDVAIVVLSGLDDETLAVRAVQEGAQDYLVKGKVDGGAILRSMRYAIERQRLESVPATWNDSATSSFPACRTTCAHQ
jgi:DNA-binding NarL/FixJ family response regulator